MTPVAVRERMHEHDAVAEANRRFVDSPAHAQTRSNIRRWRSRRKSSSTTASTRRRRPATHAMATAMFCASTALRAARVPTDTSGARPHQDRAGSARRPLLLWVSPQPAGCDQRARARLDCRVGVRDVLSLERHGLPNAAELVASERPRSLDHHFVEPAPRQKDVDQFAVKGLSGPAQRRKTNRAVRLRVFETAHRWLADPHPRSELTLRHPSDRRIALTQPLVGGTASWAGRARSSCASRWWRTLSVIWSLFIAANLSLRPNQIGYSLCE